MAYLKYSGLDQYDLQKEDRDYYCKFTVSDNNENSHDFYTNGSFCGLFFYNNFRHDYRQIRGTCDFFLGSNKRAARKKLKQLFEEWESEINRWNQ